MCKWMNEMKCQNFITSIEIKEWKWVTLTKI